jgi:LuxR family transcriptional regulator
MLVLSNHPQAYLDGFLNTGLFREAPMVVWSRDHTGAQSWRLAQERIASGTATEAELRVAEYNARFGVGAGYSLGFHDLPGRGKAGLGFCARVGLDQDAVDAIWALHGADLALLAHVAHLRIVTLAELTVGRPLSPRQREVLQWVAVGKSVQDVATILGLTLPTVEKHLRLARQALRVDTTAQAVVKATILNQILNDRRTALADWLT